MCYLARERILAPACRGLRVQLIVHLSIQGAVALITRAPLGLAWTTREDPLPWRAPPRPGGAPGACGPGAALQGRPHTPRRHEKMFLWYCY